MDLVSKTEKTNYYDRCKDLGGPHDFWAGVGNRNGISTTLHGCGHAKLNVGNCWIAHKVKVYIDGTLIGEVPKETNSKIFEFAFKEGSVLKLITVLGNAILKFNNFEVTDCICEN